MSSVWWNFLSLAAPKDVKMTTFGTINDKNFIIWQLLVQPMMKISSKWWYFHFIICKNQWYNMMRTIMMIYDIHIWDNASDISNSLLQKQMLFGWNTLDGFQLNWLNSLSHFKLLMFHNGKNLYCLAMFGYNLCRTSNKLAEEVGTLVITTHMIHRNIEQQSFLVFMTNFIHLN